MAIGDTKKLGNVGGKTLAFYLVTTAVAVAVALGIGTLLRPGIGLDMSKIQVNASDIETMESTSLVQTWQSLGSVRRPFPILSASLMIL